ncbi:amino acid permease [Candidatus Woesearchaeota archaeon]|nr:amino acid permease [Candidatus Woesearchaeota archaeon]
MKRNLLEAIATLVGTTIGAGILGLPYVIQKAGFLTGLIVIFVIGIAILFTNLAMGEIALRTPGNHQITGYASIYHGRAGKLIATFVMIFGIYGALTAYLIGEGKTLSHLFGGNEFLFSLLFFAIASLIVLFGINSVKKSELILSAISVALVLLIIILSFSSVEIKNINHFEINSLLIPFGAVFFAFLAIPSIPEMKEELIKNKALLKKAIIIGSLIPFIVYIFFSLVIIGVTGNNTTEIATIGLNSIINNKFLFYMASIFPIFAMSTAFLTLALALKEMYVYDFGLNKIFSWFLTCSVPLLLILLGVNDFIKIISIVGSIVAGIDGILVTSMWIKAKKEGKRKPEYSININKAMIFLIIVVFIFAIIKVLLDTLITI